MNDRLRQGLALLLGEEWPSADVLDKNRSRRLLGQLPTQEEE